MYSQDEASFRRRSNEAVRTHLTRSEIGYSIPFSTLKIHLLSACDHAQAISSILPLLPILPFPLDLLPRTRTTTQRPQAPHETRPPRPLLLLRLLSLTIIARATNLHRLVHPPHILALATFASPVHRVLLLELSKCAGLIEALVLVPARVELGFEDAHCDGLVGLKVKIR